MKFDLAPLWPREGLRASDEIIRCPKCKTDQPAASVLLLRTVVKRDGHYLAVITGERMACQMCPYVWSYGPNGVFEHKPTSLPFSAMPERSEPEDAPEPNGVVRRPTMPRLKQRPEV